MPGNNHYCAVASNYETAFFYETGAYQDHVVAAVGAALRLDSPRLAFADVGGGTGHVTSALAVAAALALPPLVVDPSAAMLASASARGLHVLECDALAFAAAPDGEPFDRILLKEVVHHVPDAQHAALFAGLAARLRPGGRLLVVTRPQEVDYPLWGAARAVWKANQPGEAHLMTAMAAAGLVPCRDEAVYRAQLPAERWHAMVRARFWSTFSAFTDDELEEGVAELRAQSGNADTLTFTDTLLLLGGDKA